MRIFLILIIIANSNLSFSGIVRFDPSDGKKQKERKDRETKQEKIYERIERDVNIRCHSEMKNPIAGIFKMAGVRLVKCHGENIAGKELDCNRIELLRNSRLLSDYEVMKCDLQDFSIEYKDKDGSLKQVTSDEIGIYGSLGEEDASVNVGRGRGIDLKKIKTNHVYRPQSTGIKALSYVITKPSAKDKLPCDLAPEDIISIAHFHDPNCDMELMTEVKDNYAEIPVFVDVKDEDIVQVFSNLRTEYRDEYSCINSPEDLFFLQYRNCCVTKDYEKDWLQKRLIKAQEKKVKKFKEKLQSLVDDYGHIPDKDDLLGECYDSAIVEERETCIKKVKKSNEFKKVAKLEKLLEKENKLKEYKPKKTCSNNNWLTNLKMSSSSGKPLDFSSRGSIAGHRKMFYVYDGVVYNYRDFGNFLWALSYRLGNGTVRVGKNGSKNICSAEVVGDPQKISQITSRAGGVKQLISKLGAHVNAFFNTYDENTDNNRGCSAPPEKGKEKKTFILEGDSKKDQAAIEMGLTHPVGDKIIQKLLPQYCRGFLKHSKNILGR